MYVAMLIGSIPRMGKTFALRLVLLIAALDPRARLYVFDLKGTGDLAPLEPVAYRYRAGDEDDDIDYAARRACANCAPSCGAARRSSGTCRATSARKRRSPRTWPATRPSGLHPIVVGVDECQVWFEHPRYGAEFEEICTDVVKRGPAVGIMLGTRHAAARRQVAADRHLGQRLGPVLPKVMGHTENDMVLGTSRFRQGVRATMFAWTDKGIGYFVGEGDDARIVAAAYVDAAMADAVVARARAARQAAGTLAGHAVDGAPVAVTPRYDLLADVLAVIGPDEAEGLERDRRRLASASCARPSTSAWDVEQLTARAKPYGVARRPGLGHRSGPRARAPTGAASPASHVESAIAKRDGRARAA